MLEGNPGHGEANAGCTSYDEDTGVGQFVGGDVGAHAGLYRRLIGRYAFRIGLGGRSGYRGVYWLLKLVDNYTPSL